MTDSDERPEAWKPVAPLDGCTFSGYETSDKGRARSIDRKSGNRQLRGKVLAPRRTDDGYAQVNIRCDSADPAHNRVHTVTMHKLVLTTFDKPCPRGMEACHSPKGPAFNWWPEGVRWGTKPENHADQVEAGTAVVPEAFPCRNAPACGNMVRSEGRRCLACVKQVGVDVAAMFRAGQTDQDAAGRHGNSPDWLYRVAVEHGGYEGDRASVHAVPHTPCRCLDCIPAAPREPSRNVFARLAATLRNRSRSAVR